MDKNELYEMLTATKPPVEIAVWLRQSYFPEIVRRFNSENSRKRFGLYQNEQIPMNERNLTDVRTRMGVLIEFEIARISNELLPEAGIDDIFWSYVVANRFPDLEIRNNNGERQLRLEIKCLQCIAEEKSANFDTLKKDIDPSTDYVVVCLWDWSKYRSTNCNWDSVPVIYKVYVFHAYSLTMLRDTYWLNNPPSNLGAGCQGFDVRYAVTCANGKYSKEQGNYGKLTRIWKEGFAFRPVETEELLDTESEYLAFQKEIIFEGFRILAYTQLSSLTAEVIPIEEVLRGDSVIGYKADSFIYILSSKIGSRSVQSVLQEIASENDCNTIVAMTEKYRSTIYRLKDKALTQIAYNEKPKNVLSILNPS
jgi:hypothetical protein